MRQKYEVLSSFLASWFHQDFDIEGDSIDEVMVAYLKSVRSNEADLLKDDINKFLADHPDCSGEFLESFFEMDVDPLAFAGSAREFLEQVERGIP